MRCEGVMIVYCRYWGDVQEGVVVFTIEPIMLRVTNHMQGIFTHLTPRVHVPYVYIDGRHLILQVLASGVTTTTILGIV